MHTHTDFADKSNFKNQARAGRRPARAWFLDIAFVREVGMRVCVCARPEAINN